MRLLDVRRPVLVALLLPFALASVSCGGSKKDAKSGDNTATEKIEGDATPEGDAGASADEPKSKASACTGFDLDLMAALIQSACEVQNPSPSAPQKDMKGLLEVKVTTSANKVAPGAHVDVIVTFINKGKEPLPLDFVLDPTPRFMVEAYDAKNKRIDMPAGAPPPYPPGTADRPPANQGLARVTLVPNGTAHVKLGWDANRMKWAPDKVKGTPPEMGYPRTPNGPLGGGKYSLRVVTPLTNVAEGSEHEVSAPKTPIEVGK
ncbi:MAG: hypothetical protein JWM74_1781 [Myxococcaceae bacterium]|jgi:hypothetical protein|nr:hypothetical protein [Myxococcaceae bacterium]